MRKVPKGGGLAYAPAWHVWEGSRTRWPGMRSLYPLLLPGPTAVGLLALGQQSSLQLLLAPLAVVLLVEGKRYFWNSERGLGDLVLLQLPTLLATLLLYGAVRWAPQLRERVGLDLLLGAGAVLMVLLFARGPIALYKSYLYAFPPVRMAARIRPRPLIYLPPAIALAGLLGSGVWLAARGFEFAALAPAALALLLTIWPPLLIGRAARVLAFYLRARSPIDEDLPPGVWYATTPRRARVVAWNAQAAAVSIACAAIAPTILGAGSIRGFLAAGADPASTLETLGCLAGLTIMLPGVVLLGAFAPALWSLERLKRRLLAAHRDDPRTPWECVVDRLHSSPVEWRDQEGRIVRERDHLLVGFHHDSGAPMLLHRAVLEEHAYVCGRSGSGKTSRALMPLLVQLIRGREGEDDAHPIIILDLKGDLALFHTAREEVQRSGANGKPGQEFQFFTLDSAQPGCRFNPLQTFCSRPRQSLELANQLLEALSLDYGDQYGRSFYAGGSRELLEAALQEQEARVDFPALYEHVQQDKSSKKFEIRAKLHALAGYEQLRAAPGIPAINMHKVLERRQVIYFFLDSTTGAVGAREVARLALFALLDAAIQRQKEGKPQRRAYLFIDEFQVVATVNIQQVVQQSRSRGISLVLANQSLEDLRVQGTNLVSVVQTNTRYKQFFSVNDAQTMRELTAMSGEKLVYMPSFSFSEGSNSLGLTTTTGVNWNPTFRPKLEPNEILDASAAPAGAIVHLASSYGMSTFGGAFTAILAPHCLRPEVYRGRATEPLPKMSVGTEYSDVPQVETPLPPAQVMDGPPRETPAPTPQGPEPEAPVEGLKNERAERLRLLFDQLEAAERGRS